MFKELSVVICGLVDAKIRVSDKDLPVISIIFLLIIVSNNSSVNRLESFKLSRW